MFSILQEGAAVWEQRYERERKRPFLRIRASPTAFSRISLPEGEEEMPLLCTISRQADSDELVEGRLARPLEHHRVVLRDSRLAAAPRDDIADDLAVLVAYLDGDLHVACDRAGAGEAHHADTRAARLSRGEVATPELDVQLVPDVAGEHDIGESESLGERGILEERGVLPSNGICVAIEYFDRHC